MLPLNGWSVEKLGAAAYLSSYLDTNRDFIQIITVLLQDFDVEMYVQSRRNI